MATIDLRPMQLKDEEEVRYIFLHEFLRMEPFASSVNLDPELEGETWFKMIFPNCLGNGLSLVAVDSATDKIVGLRFDGIVYKDQPDVYHFSPGDHSNRKLEGFLKTLIDLYKQESVFDKYNADKLLNIKAICVVEKYQHQGIGTKMVAQSMELMRRQKIHLATAEVSNKFSARIFSKLGFEKLVEEPYETVLMGGTRLQMTPELASHQSLSLFTKML